MPITSINCSVLNSQDRIIDMVNTANFWSMLGGRELKYRGQIKSATKCQKLMYNNLCSKHYEKKRTYGLHLTCSITLF